MSAIKPVTVAGPERYTIRTFRQGIELGSALEDIEANRLWLEITRAFLLVREYEDVTFTVERFIPTPE